MYAKDDFFQTKNGLKRFRKAKVKFDKHKNKNMLAKAGVHDLILVLDRLKPEYNVGKIIRTAETLGCRELRLIGIPFFDPEPAAGAFKHVPVKFYDEGADCIKSLIDDGYSIFSLDVSGKYSLGRFDLPPKTAFVMGHEEFGLSPELRKLKLESIKIPQFGKSQSLNVSIAASMCMWEYVRQHGEY